LADPFAAPEEAAAPATPPAPTITPEIESLIAQRVQELSDKRVAGLQSSYDKKFADQQREFQKLRTQLTGEEEPQQDPEVAAQLASLARENAILRASQKFPKAAPLYQQMIGMDTAEEQIAFIEQVLDTAARAAVPQTPAAPQVPIEELDVPDSDPNRPAPNSGGRIPDYDGVQMSEEYAARIINSVKDWPTWNQ
jgi:Skp family chaperone for outer membrane proteins